MRFLSLVLVGTTACSEPTITGSFAGDGLGCNTVVVSVSDPTGTLDEQTLGCGLFDFGSHDFSLTVPSGATQLTLAVQASGDDADDNLRVAVEIPGPVTGDGNVGVLTLPSESD